MSPSRSGAVLPILAFAALAAWAAVPRGFARADGELKLAVVDVSKIFEKHPEQKEAQRKIDAEVERRRKEYEDLLDSIEKLKGAQRTIEKDSDAWFELEKEVVKKKEEAKVRARDSERAMNEKMLEETKKLLVEIEAVIRKYCRQNGITICIKVDPGPLQDPGMGLAWKSVVYHDDSVDITDEIVKIIADRPPSGTNGPRGSGTEGAGE